MDQKGCVCIDFEDEAGIEIVNQCLKALSLRKFSQSNYTMIHDYALFSSQPGYMVK